MKLGPGGFLESFSNRRQDFIPPPLEGKIATDTLTPSSARGVYKISGPVGGGFLYTTGAEAENA